MLHRSIQISSFIHATITHSNSKQTKNPYNHFDAFFVRKLMVSMLNFSGKIIIDLELSVLCTHKYNISSWLPELVFHASFGCFIILVKNSNLKYGHLWENVLLMHISKWLFLVETSYYWFANVGVCKMWWFSRRKSFYGCITDCFNRCLTESCFLGIYSFLNVTNDWFLEQKYVSGDIYGIEIQSELLKYAIAVVIHEFIDFNHWEIS